MEPFWSLYLAVYLAAMPFQGMNPLQHSCPPGAVQQGLPPPSGTEVYCEAQKDGRPVYDGLYLEWYSNSRQKTEGHYQLGQKIAHWKFWSDDGKLHIEEDYQNGSVILRKESVEFDATDQVVRFKRTDFHSAGRPKETGEIFHGQKDGLWKAWDSAGSLERETHWSENKRNGVETLWYSNGKRKSETNYWHDVPEGNFRQWYDSGVLQIEGKYRDGLKHEKWRDWQPDGKTFTESSWWKGERVDPH